VNQIKAFLEYAIKKLDASDVPTAHLDSLVLFEEITNKDRAWLLAHPEFELKKSEIKKLESQIARRAKHEPLAYIRGKSDFYGHEFIVSPATLQPRPETETMIDLFRQLEGVKTVADIGTGSGCIAISVKLEDPVLEVFATEINQDALIIAKKNAKKLNTEVNFSEGNLLEPILNEKIDVVLANLPYVPSSHTINKAAMQEPKIAIFGGEDGLDLYREMFTQINILKTKPRYILTESLPFQQEKLTKIASENDYSLQKSDDFIQLFSC
jgi:release factor glutamine methyltransferase